MTLSQLNDLLTLLHNPFTKRVRYMTAKAIIGRHIRKQRNAKRPTLSINKLAVLAEVDSGQLSRAERGLSGLSIDALQRIANVLHISLGSLLDANSTVVNHTVSEPSACYQVNKCSKLISSLTQTVWEQLNQKQLICSKTEQLLIQHHIRTSIEEGMRRGQIRAEREIETLCKALVNKNNQK